MEWLELSGAREAILEKLPDLKAQRIPVARGSGRVLARDVLTDVDIPTVNLSAKDGYAVSLVGVGEVSGEELVFDVVGSSIAGTPFDDQVGVGQAVSITTGAAVPGGADAVVQIEDCRVGDDGRLTIVKPVTRGLDINPLGHDFSRGETVAKEGSLLTPGLLGALVSCGVCDLPVVKRPEVHVLVTGDELALPGDDLPPAGVYASNLHIISGWLEKISIPCRGQVVADHEEVLMETISDSVDRADVVITTGGAFGSSRDLVIGALERLGWEPAFRRVKMAPGKGTAFGVCKGKPVFCLPGSPSGCETAFLELAAPALAKMCGRGDHFLPLGRGRLTADLVGAKKDWTQCKRVRLGWDDQGLTVSPINVKSRARAIGEADGIVHIEPGHISIAAGRSVDVRILKYIK